MPDRDSLRFVVIGVAASVFHHMHRRAVDAEKIHVVAACGIRQEPGRQVANDLGCAFYADLLADLQAGWRKMSDVQ